MQKLLISNIKLRLDEDESCAISTAKRTLSSQHINVGDFEFSIHKKSIDARDKTDIRLVYSVLATTEIPVRIRPSQNIRELCADEFDVRVGSVPMQHRPIVVGMGPAGMFCALLLAENGYRPILIDRGDSVHDRTQTLEKFLLTGVLDTESNIQFGAGGAGTFSDGKLTTRINDSKCSYVLSRFVEFGAPSEILVKAKPHIGTDVLVNVVDNILKKVEELGGTVIYRCRMDDISIQTDRVEIETTKGRFCTQALVLALGHSARDTYRMLLNHGMLIQPKPFSIGVRIEHLQSDIDKALYGDNAGHAKLGPAEYNLSDTTDKRGVYTFCMCPGGEVVPATSQEGGVCVNGMSKFARDGANANCAVNVSVFTEDYGNDPYRAIEYQENLERKAFSAGGGGYYAPIQLVGDFLEGNTHHSPSRIVPTYGGERMTKVADLSEILPEYISRRLREGLLSFDRKIRGFAVPDAVLTGIETRTSAPVRIVRNEGMYSPISENIYPCGEGAGYAGGIMSSAVDGLKTALAIINKFKP